MFLNDTIQCTEVKAGYRRRKCSSLTDEIMFSKEINGFLIYPLSEDLIFCLSSSGNTVCPDIYASALAEKRAMNEDCSANNLQILQPARCSLNFILLLMVNFPSSCFETRKVASLQLIIKPISAQPVMFQALAQLQLGPVHQYPIIRRGYL